MAQKEITQFQEIGAVAPDDEFIIYDKDVGTTKKAPTTKVLQELTNHKANIGNPHAVTKAQVGLGNITDNEQLQKAANLSDIPDPATARTNLGVGASGDLAVHIADNGNPHVVTKDNGNPHVVTKAQVGLGNVSNDQQLLPASNLFDVADVATSRNNLGAAAAADLTAHVADTNNPHAVTRSQLGIKQTKEWYIAGALAVAVEQGGVWIVPGTITIQKAYIYCKTTGSADSTIVDVNKNGTTIFTTQANRPTLAFDNTDNKAVSGAPDVDALVEGDIVSIDIDQIATGAEDLSVILICVY